MGRSMRWFTYQSYHLGRTKDGHSTRSTIHHDQGRLRLRLSDRASDIWVKDRGWGGRIYFAREESFEKRIARKGGLNYEEKRGKLKIISSEIFNWNYRGSDG